MIRLYPFALVASLLDVPLSVVERAVELGDLPFVTIQGRRRIEADVVERFIEKRRELNTYKNAPAPLGFTWSTDTFVVTARDNGIVVVDNAGRVQTFEFRGSAC